MLSEETHNEYCLLTSQETQATHNYKIGGSNKYSSDTGITARVLFVDPGTALKYSNGIPR